MSARGLAVLLSLALAALSFAPSAAHAACPSPFSCSGNTCTLTSHLALTQDTVLDCTGKDLVLTTPAGKISVSNGRVTLIGNTLQVDSARSIDATASQYGTGYGVTIRLASTLTLSGNISATSNYGGGAIQISAGGNVTLGSGSAAYAIQANGTSSDSDGGEVSVTSATQITVQDPVTADGSATGESAGGRVALDAPTLTVSDDVTAAGTGAPGGTIVLSGISTAGGTSGQVTISNPVKAEGSGSTADGGALEVSASYSIAVNARISTQGGVGASGGQAKGGSVNMKSGGTPTAGGVSISANIDASSGGGGAAGSGGIVVESVGPITVANSVSLKSQSDSNGGDGGSIVLHSDADLTIGSATLNAKGYWASSGQGVAGDIELEGCAVSVASGAVVDAEGYEAGTIRIIGHESITVGSGSGTYVDVRGQGTGGTAGTIELVYRVTGRCSGNTALACGLCRGTCSNSPTTSCAVDTDCTIGCSTGTCDNEVCTEGTPSSCTADSQCNSCGASGPCAVNPATNGTTQFYPSAPTLVLDRGLSPCS